MAKIQTFNRNEGRRFRPIDTNSTRTLPATTATARISRPFVISHHPDSWSFDLKRGFLPNLNQVRPRPGVSGVGQDGDPTRLHAKLIADGHTLIKNEDHRLGQWQYYNYEWPVERGGKAYEFVGSRPTVRGDRVKWSAAADWDDFRDHLVRQGLVAPPIDDVMEDMIEIQSRNVGRVRELAQVGKRSTEDLANAVLMLDKMREVLAAYQGEDDDIDDDSEAAEIKPAAKVKVKR